METRDYGQLLSEYRSIWNNRLLDERGNSEWALTEAVKRELLDENSHPRTRKPPYYKFYFAVKRILDSGIANQSKLDLIEIHAGLMEELGKEGPNNGK